MADELIDRLASDLQPVPPAALPRRLFGWAAVGIVVAAAIMVPWLGLRPDLRTAPGTMMFWTKFGYTSIIAVLSMWISSSVTSGYSFATLRHSSANMPHTRR